MHKSTYLIALIILAAGMTVVEVMAGLQDEEALRGTQVFYGTASLILTALWANEDSKSNEFEKPFEFGFLIYILWPFLLPWYLYSTRKTEGLVLFIGILGLFFGPWLGGLVAYVYYT